MKAVSFVNLRSLAFALTLLAGVQAARHELLHLSGRIGCQRRNSAGQGVADGRTGESGDTRARRPCPLGR